MIGVDWGTSNFRAFLLDDSGAIRARRTAPCGVTHVAEGGFASVLRAHVGDWMQQGEQCVLLAGAVGSREGWVNAGYLQCPAGAAELSRNIVAVPFEGALVRLVPGVCSADAQGVPDTMHGEETQIIGVCAALGERGLVCLPGTHSKWVHLQHGRITSIASHMTGEAFAALQQHTLLARTTRAGAVDEAAFDRGLMRAANPGGLLHHLFGVRALALFGQLDPGDGYSYLSALLIGHEVQAALPRGELVHLVGDPALCALYARAIAACGGEARIEDADAAARGLARIGQSIDWH